MLARERVQAWLDAFGLRWHLSNGQVRFAHGRTTH
jgi:hypothetical protein